MTYGAIEIEIEIEIEKHTGWLSYKFRQTECMVITKQKNKLKCNVSVAHKSKMSCSQMRTAGLASRFKTIADRVGYHDSLCDSFWPTPDGTCDTEINRRIGKAEDAFKKMEQILKCTNISEISEVKPD
jgi:hypothetical protein